MASRYVLAAIGLGVVTAVLVLWMVPMMERI